MKILNVAEKPSIARQLVKALDFNKNHCTVKSFSKYNPVYSFEANFQGTNVQVYVTSVTGHIKEMYYVNNYGWQNIDPQKLLFDEQVDIRVSPDKQNLAKNLDCYARKSFKIFLWLDCDREGEAIAYEVLDICLKANSNLKVLRAKFSSTDPNELRQAFNQPIEPDKKQNEAVLARQELDLRSGSTFTRYITVSINANFNLNKAKLSYGTCQIPTLSFIVQRYLEIKQFKPRPFYSIVLSIKKDNIETQFQWQRQRLFEKYICAAIYQKIYKNPMVKIIDIKNKQKKKFKPYPLATIDFQKLASSYLGLGSKQAMNIAEKLYQQGYISYPRTETNSYPSSTNFQQILKNLKDNDEYFQYLDCLSFQRPRDGKKDDKAHPPIHPIKNYNQYEDTMEYKVFDLISRRFIANCSEDAVYQEVEVIAEVDEELFTIKGVQIIEKNYLEIYEKFEKFKDKKIPKFEIGKIYEPHKLLFQEGLTTPPKLLSESDLITIMDKNQIGTDATIHEHIDKIIKRNYTKKIKKLFHPTQLGVALILTLQNLNLRIDNPLLRAQTEVWAQDICDGKQNRQVMLQKFLQIMEEDFIKLKQNQEDLIRVFIQSYNEHQNLEKQKIQMPSEIILPSFSKTNYNNQQQNQQNFSQNVKLQKCTCKKNNLIAKISAKGQVYIKCEDWKSCKKFFFLNGGPYIQIEQTDEKCNLCSKKIIYLSNENNEKISKCNSKKKSFHLQTLKAKKIPKCYVNCKENQNLDFIQKLDCFSKCQRKNDLLKQKIEIDKLKSNFSQLPNNYCLKEREAKTYKQKLKFFAEGPCSPLILAPGTISTKLIVQIDCKVLRTKNPDLFQTCGWNECEKQMYEFWKKVPKKEYKLWINDVVSPISFFGGDQANMCFSKLFQSFYDFKQQQDHWILKTEGYKVSISGFTKETMANNHCGADAIRNLLPIPIQLKQTHVFSNLIDEIERIGYTTGLTYQAMPYNFYNSIFQSEFTINFKKQVLRLFKLTGKKITIVAHSNGNLLTLYNLQTFFNQTEKEKYFRNFVSLAAPILGAYQANRYILGGNNTFIDSTEYLGFKWNAAKIFYDNQSSLFFFSIRNFDELYKNEEWYKKVQKRLKYERNKDIPYDDSGINFWPKKEDVCYKDNLKDFPQNCLLDFEDPNEDFIFIGDKEKYGIKNFSQAIQKHIDSDVAYQLYQRIFPINIGAINPGIPTFLVYVGLLKTDHKIHFNESFDENSSTNKYPKIDSIESIRGDGSVPSTSFLLPSLRWALKSDEGDNNYKKVTFVEMCSQMNQKDQVYDGADTDGSKIFVKNQYMGYECECSNSSLTSYKDCKHSDIISDKFFVELVTKIVDVNKTCSDEQLQFIDQIEEEYLQNQSEYCTHYVTDMYQTKQNDDIKIVTDQ